MLRRRQYREPESAQAVLAPDIPKMDQTVDRKRISRIFLVGGILGVASMALGRLMRRFS
jgi:hypothetical protein